MSSRTLSTSKNTKNSLSAGLRKIRLSDKRIENSFMKRILVLLYDFNDKDNKDTVMITEKRIDFINKEIKLFDTLAALLVIADITVSFFEVNCMLFHY